MESFKNRAFIEIPGTDNNFPCQKKAIACAVLANELREKPTIEAKDLAAKIALVQPPNNSSYVTPKIFRNNVLKFCGQKLSNSEANKFLKDINEEVHNKTYKIWQKQVEKYCGVDEVYDSKSQVQTFFATAHELKLPIFLAIYLGSPTLDEVMQHRFQYIYQYKFDEEAKSYLMPANFNEVDVACGEKPQSLSQGLYLHSALPSCFYLNLSTKNFLKNFPDKKSCGANPVARLSLPMLNLAAFMKYGIDLMEQDPKIAHEPGLDFGKFIYPLSLYHFSFCPSFPKSEEESFLDRKLHHHDNYIELASAEYRTRFESTDFHALEIYPVFPNPMYPTCAPMPGYEFYIVKNHKKYLLRLVAGKETIYAHESLWPEKFDQESKRHFDGPFTIWKWNSELSGFFVYSLDGKKQIFEDNLNNEEIVRAFNLIKKNIKAHLEKNFCYKTKFLIAGANIDLSSFDNGILKEENAVKFYENAKAIKVNRDVLLKKE
ncbi:MAG: hypothetical protein H6731_09310 [Myxococcales bacterium]|nr:MAG: hypothetical protein H6731_09310 [Myxococcales bacterium]